MGRYPRGLDAFDRARARVTLHVPLREPRDFSFYEDRSGVFWILYASGNGLAILVRDASGAHLTVQVVLHAIQDFR